METINTFSVLFHLRNDKVDETNQAPVYMRVTVDGVRVEIATNRKFDISRWKDGHPVGMKQDVKILQRHLDGMKAKVYDIQTEMQKQHELITAEKIKSRFLNRNQNSKTLIEVFEYHNKQLNGLVGKDYSKATATRYATTLTHIREYMKYQYKCDDMYLTELKYDFISGLEYYFKTIRKCNHNSTMKYIKNFRKVINMAVKFEWILRDPFARFYCTINPVERDFLNKEELTILEEKKIHIQRIDRVRDIFVFCCYTGLAYADAEKLSTSHIVNGIDGEKWIHLNRTKTDTKSLIPLLPKAIEIIEKYNPNLYHHYGTLLPVSSNQKMNAYLKELAAICGINKDLTFHIARHTFATTVTLTNGVPIESVSAMLGHKNIRTTQIYSKVVEQKLSHDMLSLRDKLTGQSRLNNQNAIVQE